MGAAQFTNVIVAKDVHEAFDRARSEAAYIHGHGGYTGTIAEKTEFKLAGQVDSWHWDQLHAYFEREVVRAEGIAMNRGERLPGKLAPAKLRSVIETFASFYDDKWGPAIAFQITGLKALDFKRQAGRIESHDKVFIFVGWASE